MNTFRRMNFAPKDSMLTHFMLFPPDEMDFDTRIFSVYWTQQCFWFHFQHFFFFIFWAFTCYQPFDSNFLKNQNLLLRIALEQKKNEIKIKISKIAGIWHAILFLSSLFKSVHIIYNI